MDERISYPTIGLTDALKAAVATDKPSMGDPEFAENQVRQMLLEAVEVRKAYNADDKPDAHLRAQQAIEALVEKWAAELGAGNDAYLQTMTADGQDQFLKARGFGDKGVPGDGMRALVADTVGRLMNAMIEAEQERISDDDLQFQIDAAVEDALTLIMATDAPVEPAQDAE